MMDDGGIKVSTRLVEANKGVTRTDKMQKNIWSQKLEPQTQLSDTG